MRKSEISNKEYEVLRNRDYQKPNSMINSIGVGTKLSQKLFAVGMNYVKRDSTGCAVMEISGNELKKLFGAKGNSLYGEIEKSVDKDLSKDHSSIFDWVILLKDKENGKLIAHQVITDAMFENGTLSLRYNRLLSDDILERKKDYTVLKLNEVLPLKCQYSIPLYERLKSAFDKKSYIDKMKKGVSEKKYAFYMNKTELKFNLGVVTSHGDKTIKEELDNEYPNYEKIEEILDKKGWNKYKANGEFMRSVVNKAIKEINACTSLNIESALDREGKFIKGIYFYVSELEEKDITNSTEIKKDLTDEEKDAVLDEVVDKLIATFKYTEIKNICEHAGYDKDKIYKGYDFVKSYNQEIESPIALIKWAITNEADPKENKKKSYKYDEFTQNEYDFDELEKSLTRN